MAIKPIEILIRAKDEASGILGSMQAKLLALGAAVAGFFGIALFAGAVKGASELQAKLSEVEAVSGATAAEMRLLKKAAEDAGSTTKFTASEAAEALGNLSRAGLSAKDSIAALPAVLSLAQAGGIGLAEASGYVTKATMGMGLAFTDAGRVADVLAMGANASNTSVTGLAQALSYAAPTAKSLGLSLELTVAIIGKFADAGIDASRAGTALNAIMGQFSDPASKFRQELGAAGIITGNFEQALRELAKAGPAGQKAINAVGLEAGPALKALLGQGIGALDDLKGKLDDAAGSAAKTAATMENNLPGAMRSLGSAWDTVKNVLGTPVLPVLKDGVDQLSGALRGMVSDGTIGKFGDAMATAFQSGLKWAREFIAQIDFAAITARMQAFADRSGEVFAKIGEYATTTGNTVQTVYGVMSAGANAVMVVVYKIAEAFAGVASNIQSAIALIMEGLAKVTFGGVSESFKVAAAEIRLSAEATWAASEALAKKAEESFNAMADGAQMARDGFAGLANGASAAGAASAKASADVKDLAKSSEDAGAKAQQSAAKQVAAAQATRAAVAQLKTEYEAALAAGNVQLALEKLQAMKAALQGTADQAKLTAADIEAAFQRMGVTSSAELKKQADAALRDYKIIRDAGTSTAADVTAAFRVYAEKSIAANNGVATETLKNEAAMKGLEIQTDATGKAIIKAMGDGSAAAQEFGQQIRANTEDLKAQAAALAAIHEKYSKPGGGSTVDTSGGDREKFLAGQNAVDNSLQFALMAKFKQGTLSAADIDDVKRYLQAQEQQNQVNRDLDKFGGRFSAAGTLDRAKWEQFQALMINWLDDQKHKAAPSPNPVNTNQLNSVVNINLNGSTRSIHTDAAGAATLQDVLRQLADARGSSSVR